MDKLHTDFSGFGLGLRTPHYPDFLAGKQPLDWLEIITDNYLVEGGKPLVMLDQIRRDYPVAMHGVAMSLGAPGQVDQHYLQKVKKLAQRIEPLWVSDHLCWIGPGPQQLHDLYPLPYTQEAARHVIEQIRRVQDVLQRRFVLENVSSYIDFKQSAASEWQFLSYVAHEADCLLLVDINNIYVSSVNHGFDPLHYLRGLPAHRVQQMHLAGHTVRSDCIIDTHDHPVADPVWALYAEACRLFTPVATMIERDDHIPSLQTLIDELALARNIAGNIARGMATGAEEHPGTRSGPAAARLLFPPEAALAQPGLSQLQRLMADYVLAMRPDPAEGTSGHPRGSADLMADLLRDDRQINVADRLLIYHNAFRARLAEVLADTFSKTCLYMGSNAFDPLARAFAASHPPLVRNLNRYGSDFPDYLKSQYPGNPELYELACLDRDLRTRFDGADVPALNRALVAADPAQSWLTRTPVLQPSVCLASIGTNVVQLWKAMDDDLEVPQAIRLDAPTTLVVWRKDLQPHFQTLGHPQAAFLQSLAAGLSIADACDKHQDSPSVADLETFAGWLAQWWDDGWLMAQDAPPTSSETASRL